MYAELGKPDRIIKIPQKSIMFAEYFICLVCPDYRRKIPTAI